MRINDKTVFEKENVFGLGNANTAYAQYFIGNSYLNPLTEAGKLSLAAGTTGMYTMQRAAADRS